MFVKNKVAMKPNLWKKKTLLEQDLDLDLDSQFLLLNEWNKMLPVQIIHLTFEIIMTAVFIDLDLKLKL